MASWPNLLTELEERCKRNADVLNSLSSYESPAWDGCDGGNLNNAEVGKTLRRLVRVDYKVLEGIIASGGVAKYQHEKYEAGFCLDCRILVWFKFSFEQRTGRKVLVRNHATGETFLANSMTAAKDYIRFNY